MHEPHFLKILKVQAKETVKGSFCFENKITFLIYILQIIIDIPGSSDGKELACNAGGWGLIPGLGRSPVERNSNPLQYSCLGNPMDRVAWQATVHGVSRVGHDLATKPSTAQLGVTHCARYVKTILCNYIKH